MNTHIYKNCTRIPDQIPGGEINFLGLIQLGTVFKQSSRRALQPLLCMPLQRFFGNHGPWFCTAHCCNWWLRSIPMTWVFHLVDSASPLAPDHRLRVHHIWSILGWVNQLAIHRAVLLGYSCSGSRGRERPFEHLRKTYVSIWFSVLYN